MKKNILFLLCLILFTINNCLFAQGSLTPPGAPGPTMKTLAQIEPRTPISSLPYTITIPGSYYVTTNLTGTAANDGIDIKTNDVTLNLGGFTLLGVAGSGAGINVINPAKNLSICNGVLDSWGANGVASSNGYNCQFERLRVSNCNSNGGFAGLYAGVNCVIMACTASGNADEGIAGVSNCTVKDCIASGNSSDGIAFLNNCTIKDCTASGNIAGIGVSNNCTVRDCTASGNNFVGIVVFGNNCQIAGNTCSGNSSYGIQIYGGQNRIDGNVAGNNGVNGIFPTFQNVTNSIVRNSAAGNGSGGYGNNTGNNDYAPTQTPNTSTNPWANF